MSAEHGCFLRPIKHPKGFVPLPLCKPYPCNYIGDSPPEVGEWQDLVQEKGIAVGWKDKVIEVFNSYAKRLQGSSVERKEYAITFHYRLCNKEASKGIIKELREELQDLTTQFPSLHALKGKKSVEARLKGITKGVIIRHVSQTA
jgi:trehalose-phosphatase